MSGLQPASRELQRVYRAWHGSAQIHLGASLGLSVEITGVFSGS